MVGGFSTFQKTATISLILAFCSGNYFYLGLDFLLAMPKYLMRVPNTDQWVPAEREDICASGVPESEWKIDYND